LFSSAALVDTPPWQLLCDVLGKPPEDAALLAARTGSCREILGVRTTAEALAPSLLLRVAQDLSLSQAGAQPRPIPASAVS
jgi:hypothetical protein